MATEEEKRYAMKYFVTLANSLCCKDLYHSEKHQHKPDFVCLAEYHRNRQVHIMLEMIKELDPE